MKKSVIVNSLICVLCAVIVFLMAYTYGIPIRINAYYNYVFKILPSQTELYGYEISKDYFVDGNKFNIILENSEDNKKVFVVILDYFTKVKGYSVEEFSEYGVLKNIDKYKTIGLLNRVNEFNTVFAYNHIDKTPYLRYKDNIIQSIKNGEKLGGSLSSCSEDVGRFRENLLKIYIYYNSIYPDLEELQSFDIFCDRIITGNMFYDVTNTRVGISIDSDYKVHRLGFRVYIEEDGVVYVEK